MGRVVALLAGSALVVAACGSGSEVVRLDSTPAPTSAAPTSTSPTTTTSTLVASTSVPVATTVPPTTTPAPDAADPAIVALVARIGASDPFGPDGGSYHFAVTFDLLDVEIPTPSDRTAATFVNVLEVVGDASPSAAQFTMTDPTNSVDGRIVGNTVWMHSDEGWKPREATDPVGEVVSVSYANWAILLIQMVDLTGRFSSDLVLTTEPWESGEHVTITASTPGTSDPLVAAGMPIASEVWIDEHGVVRRADVQGFVLWKGDYLPAAMSLQIDAVPEPVIVAPTENLAVSG